MCARPSQDVGHPCFQRQGVLMASVHSEQKSLTSAIKLLLQNSDEGWFPSPEALPGSLITNQESLLLGQARLNTRHEVCFCPPVVNLDAVHYKFTTIWKSGENIVLGSSLHAACIIEILLITPSVRFFREWATTQTSTRRISRTRKNTADWQRDQVSWNLYHHQKWLNQCRKATETKVEVLIILQRVGIDRML